MAQRTIVQLTDDLDGTAIREGKGETVRFGFDGTEYEIDLSDKNVNTAARPGRSGRGGWDEFARHPRVRAALSVVTSTGTGPGEGQGDEAAGPGGVPLPGHHEVDDLPVMVDTQYGYGPRPAGLR